MEFEQKIRGTASGYCTVEDGVIYEMNLYGGSRTRVGVTDATYNELKALADDYYNKLVELGAIVPPKTPEQMQQETAELMAGMLSEIKQLKQQMEGLTNERKNLCANAGAKPAEHRKAMQRLEPGTAGEPGRAKPAAG